MSESAVKKFNNRQWKKLKIFNFSKNTIFKMIKDGSVLDIGCGDGLLLEHLSKEKGLIVKGIDISERAIEICTERGLDCLCEDITDVLPFADNAYQNVLLIDVLEHMFEPLPVLKEAARVSGKYVFISTPNFVSLPARIQVWRGNTPENNTPRDGHVYWMTRKVVHELIAKAELRIEEEITNTFWENVPIFKYIIRPLNRFFPLSFWTLLYN